MERPSLGQVAVDQTIAQGDGSHGGTVPDQKPRRERALVLQPAQVPAGGVAHAGRFCFPDRADRPVFLHRHFRADIRSAFCAGFGVWLVHPDTDARGRLCAALFCRAAFEHSLNFSPSALGRGVARPGLDGVFFIREQLPQPGYEM